MGLEEPLGLAGDQSPPSSFVGVPNHTPPEPLLYLPSPCICLFWTLHTDRTTQFVAFCVWLLSLGVLRV